MGNESSRKGSAGGTSVADVGKARNIARMNRNVRMRLGRGNNYNLKVILRGDRKTGKTSMLNRLKGMMELPEYEQTKEITIENIPWTYKTSEDTVKVEVWDVVDVAPKEVAAEEEEIDMDAPAGLGMEKDVRKAIRGSTTLHALDATTVDVYKGTNCVIFMVDPQREETLEYVMRELPAVPERVSILVVSNFRDVEVGRCLKEEDIRARLQPVMDDSKAGRLSFIECSMLNCFGMKQLHTYFAVPFLAVKRDALRQQLEDAERDFSTALEELAMYVEVMSYDKFLAWQETQAAAKKEKAERLAKEAERASGLKFESTAPPATGGGSGGGSGSSSSSGGGVAGSSGSGRPIVEDDIGLDDDLDSVGAAVLGATSGGRSLDSFFDGDDDSDDEAEKAAAAKRARIAQFLRPSGGDDADDDVQPAAAAAAPLVADSDDDEDGDDDDDDDDDDDAPDRSSSTAAAAVAAATAATVATATAAAPPAAAAAVADSDDEEDVLASFVPGAAVASLTSASSFFADSDDEDDDAPLGAATAAVAAAAAASGSDGGDDDAGAALVPPPAATAKVDLDSMFDSDDELPVSRAMDSDDEDAAAAVDTASFDFSFSTKRSGSDTAAGSGGGSSGLSEAARAAIAAAAAAAGGPAGDAAAKKSKSKKKKKKKKEKESKKKKKKSKKRTDVSDL